MAAPVEWNQLPLSFRSQQIILGFRSQRSTYLFRLAYPPAELVISGRKLAYLCSILGFHFYSEFSTYEDLSQFCGLQMLLLLVLLFDKNGFFTNMARKLRKCLHVFLTLTCDIIKERKGLPENFSPPPQLPVLI